MDNITTCDSGIKQDTKKLKSFPSPHIDFTMFLRDTATAAVGITCLLLMVAHRPIQACSCFQSTDEESFCRAEELVKLTVMEEKEIHVRGDAISSKFYFYKVRIDEVFKTKMGLTDGTDMDLKTPRISAMCALQLSSGSKYLLSAYADDGVLNANVCSWVRKWNSLGQDVVKLLRGEVQPKCA